MDTIEVEEIDHDVEFINCPFCNNKVVDLPQDSEVDIQPCGHLLFVATDAGFEYCSDLFLKHMKITNGDEVRGTSYDEYTSTVSIPGSIKYASYVPAPSFFGVYFGFAPGT